MENIVLVTEKFISQIMEDDPSVSLQGLGIAADERVTTKINLSAIAITLLDTAIVLTSEIGNTPVDMTDRLNAMRYWAYRLMTMKAIILRNGDMFEPDIRERICIYIQSISDPTCSILKALQENSKQNLQEMVTVEKLLSEDWKP